MLQERGPRRSAIVGGRVLLEAVRDRLILPEGISIEWPGQSACVPRSGPRGVDRGTKTLPRPPNLLTCTRKVVFRIASYTTPSSPTILIDVAYVLLEVLREGRAVR